MSDGVRSLLFDPATKILIVTYIGTICGIIAAGIASDRGRRPWPAFLLGFFTSVFGVFAVALSDRDDDRPAPSAGFGERWTRRLGWAFIIAAGVIAYCNSFTVPFVFDGANYLLENEKIRLFKHDNFGDNFRDLTSNSDLWDAFAGFAQTRVVCYLTFAFDHGCYRYDVEFWHRTSLLIHVVAALALYGIARHAFTSPRFAGRFEQSFERLSLTIALFWVVHPLNTQSVTYLYQRLESLMGMFYMLTIFTCARASRASTWQRAWSWCAVSVAFCALGMASKEVMVTAPLVTLWYDRVFLARSWGGLLRRRTVYYLALFATLGISSWLMHRTYHHKTDNYAKAGIADPLRQSPQEYAITQLGVIRHYLKRSIVPTNLNIDHAWPGAIEWREWPDKKWPFFHTMPKDFAWEKYADRTTKEFKDVTIPAMIVGGLVMLTLIAMIASPPLGFLGGSFFVVLAPTSSFVPIVDYCFEHRTYVSLAAVMALVVVAGDVILRWASLRLKLISPTVAAWIGAVLVLGVAGTFTGLTIRRNYDYRSTLELWHDAAEKAPKNQRAQYNYGVYLQRTAADLKDQKSPEAKALVEQAVAQYHKTLKIDPNYAEAYVTLGRIYNFRGDYVNAEEMFRNLLRFENWRPAEYREGLAGLAGVYHLQQRYVEARPLFHKALQLDPTRDEKISWLYQLAYLENALGNYDLAEQCVAQVLALDPDHTEAPKLRNLIELSRSSSPVPP